MVSWELDPPTPKKLFDQFEKMGLPLCHSGKNLKSSQGKSRVAKVVLGTLIFCHFLLCSRNLEIKKVQNGGTYEKVQK